MRNAISAAKGPSEKSRKAFGTGKAFLLRLPKGSDIIEELTHWLSKHHVRCAAVQIIGATTKITIGYYDLKRRKYLNKTFNQEMELLSCVGNVSLKDGKPFAHLHATLGDTNLRAWGGHLFPGSRVFAAEAFILELKGRPLVRHPDPATGLALWDKASLVRNI